MGSSTWQGESGQRSVPRPAWAVVPTDCCPEDAGEGDTARPPPHPQEQDLTFPSFPSRPLLPVRSPPTRAAGTLGSDAVHPTVL